MTDALKVMTFNIRHGRALDLTNRWYRRRDIVFDVIRTYGPHILGLQEVDPFQLDEIADEFPTHRAIAHRRYGGIIGAYAPILFDARRLEPGPSGDFWLSPDPDGRRRRGWDAAVVRLCTWAVLRDRSNSKRLAAFNTHFDQRGLEARRESARLLATRLDGMAHLPHLVTADLNANESSRTLAILVKAGMRDTFRVARPDEPAYTFHAFRGPNARGRLGKIDYVLCDDRFTVEGAGIVRTSREGRLPSDHYPVTADLVLG